MDAVQCRYNMVEVLVNVIVIGKHNCASLTLPGLVVGLCRVEGAERGGRQSFPVA
jgi:hypothetical protein